MRYSLVNTRDRFSEEEPPTARQPRVVAIGRRLLAILEPLSVSECEILLKKMIEWVKERDSLRAEEPTRLVQESDLDCVTHIKIDF